MDKARLLVLADNLITMCFESSFYTWSEDWNDFKEEVMEHCGMTAKEWNEITGEMIEDKSDKEIMRKKIEAELIQKIDEAKEFCVGELELDLEERDTGGYGWYARDYRRDFEAAMLISNDKYNEPLITEEVAQKYSIDVTAICDLCDIYYCE